jgi:hypothetical protein
MGVRFASGGRRGGQMEDKGGVWVLFINVNDMYKNVYEAYEER